MDGEAGQSDVEIQLVTFSVGGEEFGVDVMKVEGVIPLTDITRMPRAPEFVEGIINLRGQVIAVIDLAARLEIPPAERGSATRIVVVEAGDVKVGMVVELPEVMSVPAGDVEPSPSVAGGDLDSSLVKGVVKAGERLLILLDLDNVLTEEQRGDVGELEAGQGMEGAGEMEIH